MNEYTQPSTDAERKRVNEFRLQGAVNAGTTPEPRKPLSGEWLGLAPYDGGDGPNLGMEIDWLEINREFGI